MAVCLLLLLSVSACAGAKREANLAPVRHVGDASKSCLELKSEIYSTNLRAGQKHALASDKHTKNVFLGLAVPLALNMDISETDWKEAKALGRRRDYLAKLFNQFGCQGYLGFNADDKSR
ncbi:MAG: hypothetical protein ACPGVN_00805 [Alphaproteobacteria bacterium]